MKISHNIFYTIIIFVHASCNNGQDTKSTKKEFNQIIEDAIELMPLNYQENYKYDTFTIQENNLEEYYGIREDYNDNFYSEIDRLISKDLGVCIDSLMKVNSLNIAFEPQQSNFYKNNEYIIYNKKFKSLQTNSHADIYLLFKDFNHYKSFHFFDTIKFESNVFATGNEMTVFGQLKRSKDCTRNYKVKLTDSINYFTISNCTKQNIVVKKDKKYKFDSIFNK